MKSEEHLATQRDDGSIYCYCPDFPNEKIGVSINYAIRTMICSACGKKVKEVSNNTQ